MQQQPTPKTRLEALDLARGVALVAMAIYHFAWDLEFFGYAEPGMTAQGGWKLFARGIASSFLFLVGVSLFLAHRNGVRWWPFAIRLAMVAGAAAAISIATFLATPDSFIFFGILHQIALASVLGLLFLRLPALLILILAVAVIALPWLFRAAIFDHPALWWVGLSTVNPRSNDYVPLFPWFGAVLAGIAAAHLAEKLGLFARLRVRFPSWTRPLQLAGRHSLAVYLVHQPVLIALIWLFSQVAPPAQTPRDIEFVRACTPQCSETRDADFCSFYCVCVVDRLVKDNRFDEVFEGRQSPETSQRLQDFVEACTFEADRVTGEETQP